MDELQAENSITEQLLRQDAEAQDAYAKRLAKIHGSLNDAVLVARPESELAKRIRAQRQVPSPRREA